MPIEATNEDSIIQRALDAVRRTFAPRQHYHTGADSPRLNYTNLDMGGSVAALKYSHNLVFSSSDADTVAWAAGAITFDNGQEYSIAAGNTGNMTARTYIYLNTVVSVTALQISTTYSDAVGTNKVLLAVAENVAGSQAIFQVFTGYGGIAVTGVDLPPDTNLALYWPLDEASNVSTVSDLSINNSPGTMNGTMTAADWVAGVSGTALDLDGTDDYLSAATPTFIDNTQGAVSLWVKLDTLTTQQTIWSVSVDGSTDDEFSLFFRGDDNKKLEIVLLVNGAAQIDQTSAANTINDTNWHHVVLQSDGSTIKLYVDSVLQTLSGTGTNSGQWLDDATQANIFTVGCLKRASAIAFLDGRVDEVRIHSDDLTIKQIEALYKSPGGNKSAGAVNVNGQPSWLVQPRAYTLYEKFVFIGSVNDAMNETPGAGGTITRVTMFTEIDAANTVTGKLLSHTFGLFGALYGWNNVNWDVIIFMDQEITGVAEAQDIYIGLIGAAAIGNVPADATLTTEHIGFFSADGVLKASNANGTTQTTTTIAGITLTNWNQYRIDATTARIRFYVNDVLVATHTTNLPTGTTEEPYLYMGIEPQGGTQRWIRISNNYSVISTLP